jgi:hypothetical protein
MARGGLVEFLRKLAGIVVPDADSVSEIIALIDETDEGYFNLVGDFFGVYAYVESMDELTDLLRSLAVTHGEDVQIKLSIIPYPYEIEAWVRDLLKTRTHRTEQQRVFWESLISKYTQVGSPPLGMIVSVFSQKELVIKTTLSQIKDYRKMYPLRMEELQDMFKSWFPNSTIGYGNELPRYDETTNEEAYWADLLTEGMHLSAQAKKREE